MPSALIFLHTTHAESISMPQMGGAELAKGMNDDKLKSFANVQ